VSGVAETLALYERVEPGSRSRLRDDERVVLHARTWADYEALLEMRGESSVPRITFVDGEMELMAPGILHEDDKKKLARILEAWADETGQFLDGFGSWTLKNQKKETGGEPDECYVVSERSRTTLKRPDFAIEVARTSGGLPKLEVYRRLGVREVWFWIDGELRFFVLRGRAYVERDRSAILPALDPALVRRAMRQTTQPAAVRALKSALRAKSRRA
jgi:Uma2 family endonuclease